MNFAPGSFRFQMPSYIGTHYELRTCSVCEVMTATPAGPRKARINIFRYFFYFNSIITINKCREHKFHLIQIDRFGLTVIALNYEWLLFDDF